jgi:hypothetical protein
MEVRHYRIAFRRASTQSRQPLAGHPDHSRPSSSGAGRDPDPGCAGIWPAERHEYVVAKQIAGILRGDTRMSSHSVVSRPAGC